MPWFFKKKNPEPTPEKPKAEPPKPTPKAPEPPKPPPVAAEPHPKTITRLRLRVPVEPENLQPVEWTPKGTETQIEEVEPLEDSKTNLVPPPPAAAPAEPAAPAPAAPEPPAPALPAGPGFAEPARPLPILLAEPARAAGGREDVAHLLLREGLLTQEDLERILGDHPPAWAKDLLDAGSVRWRSLVDLVGGVYRLPAIRLEDAGVDEEAMDELPAATIRRIRILPFAKIGRLLCLAASAFPARSILDEISALLGPSPFKIFQCDASALEQALSEHLPRALERDQERTLDAWPDGEVLGHRLPAMEEALPESDEDAPLTPLPLDEA